MILLLIGVIGFVTLIFDKSYTVESNLMSNANWYKNTKSDY
ncbi:MAG: hypothetical protein U9O97_03450 [Elusimicrobiota bacterium]|nr:hypothetical protein [Elusimicrobiota bacterium]